MPRTRIKICGLTRACDAQAAARAGADALGVILAPGHRRSVTPLQAADVFADAPPGVERVGVFVDASLDEVGDAVRLAGLTEVQLHGGESRAYCSRLREFVPGVRVVKTLHVGDAFDPASVASYAGTVDAILLDTLVPGARGGTGAAFDWALARTLPRDVALYLAGGLAPHSVAEAMSVAAPDGVDVSSGVESTPGEKDPTRIDAFVAAVRGADATTTDMTKDE